MGFNTFDWTKLFPLLWLFMTREIYEVPSKNFFAGFRAEWWPYKLRFVNCKEKRDIVERRFPVRKSNELGLCFTEGRTEINFALSPVVITSTICTCQRWTIKAFVYDCSHQLTFRVLFSDKEENAMQGIRKIQQTSIVLNSWTTVRELLGLHFCASFLFFSPLPLRHTW